METRKPKWKDRAAYFEPSAAPPEHQCDHPDCEAEGRFRAPKSRNRLSEYHWFCIDHVREYNAGWDYCDGMDEAEIDEAWRRDVTWNRPSWPFGTAGFNPRPRSGQYGSDQYGSGQYGSAGGENAGRKWQDRDWHEREQELRAAFARAFDGDTGPRADERRRRAWTEAGESFDRAGGARTRAHDHALSVLDLDYPVDFPTVKARYKALVKEHHPDRHGGSRSAEEKLKAINLAYSTLKAAMAS